MSLLDFLDPPKQEGEKKIIMKLPEHIVVGDETLLPDNTWGEVAKISKDKYDRIEWHLVPGATMQVHVPLSKLARRYVRVPRTQPGEEVSLPEMGKASDTAAPAQPEQSRTKVVEGFRLVLEGLGLDLSSPHLFGTPERAAKAWWEELCKGITQEPPQITTFPSSSDEMVLLKNIPIRSMCAHHLLPFMGTAAIAYIPGRGEILGLSKLSRIADYWARRPQVQEDLTEQIADDLAERVMGKAYYPDDVALIPENLRHKGGVGVVIRANHLCMAIRGVNHSGDMITSALRGVFRTHAETRDEFLKLVQGA